MSTNRTPLLGAFLLLTMVFSPLVAAEDPLTATILTDWQDDGTGNQTHAYRIVLSESLSFTELGELSLTVVHNNETGALQTNISRDWTGGNDTELTLVLNTTVEWKDQITITVFDGTTTIGSRTVLVTIWNEPMADHEITRTTTWHMTHSQANFTGNEVWDLQFTGQGWQQRTGDVLEANELGMGTLQINESTNGGTGTVGILLLLDTVWFNETTIGLVLQSQIFEMRGNGSIDLFNTEDGTDIDIHGNVVNSYIIRSLDQGVVEEQLRLEANGDLHMSSSGGDQSMEANGTLALLLLETHDIDGERILQNTEFEGTADMVMQGEDYYMNLDISQIVNHERWENGEFVSSLSRVQGDGDLDFSDSENGSSITVNATVHEFFQESVDKQKTGDRIHYDGTISGTVNGDFSGERDIIATEYMQANATGVEFPVNVIYTESWFNVSTGGGNPWDLSNVHNETWDYEVPQEDWENRTVRLRWDSMENGEPSQGDEYPERSPIQNPIAAPESEEGIGGIDISRETGLAPATMLVGDSFALLDSDLMQLTVTAIGTSTVNRDGHTIPVTQWTGTYGGDGVASGSVVNEGVLAGLVATVTRNVTLDLEDGESLFFEETQSLERVLSPSIITASENTPPAIVSVSIREGALTNEDGGEVHLEVEVSDPDWNVRAVTVDLSALGLGLASLNDVGIDGDTAIHDDVFTGQISYSGIIDGAVSLEVTVEDDWATTTETHDILVLNRMPQVQSVTFIPNTLNRGESTTVTASVTDGSGVTAVGIETIQWGGETTWLTLVNGEWTGTVIIPDLTPSGDQFLPVRVEDAAGGEGMTTQLSDGSAMSMVHILNVGPAISDLTFYDNDGEVTTLAIPVTGINAYTMTANVTDVDPITIVQARLGLIAQAGQSESWVSMRDDGIGVDAIAGDGIYSVMVQVRPGVPGGPTTIDIRGIDQQLAQTPVEDRSFTVTLGSPDTGEGPGSEALFEFTSQVWIIISVILIFTLLSIIGIVTWIRKGGLEDMMGTEQEGLGPD
jgi:hypothetical protein